MTRLIFVNRFFFPDHSATSQILSDLTFHLAAAGHEVHVLSSRQIYDEPDADLPRYETINGVNVHRIASTRIRPARFAGTGARLSIVLPISAASSHRGRAGERHCGREDRSAAAFDCH